MRFWEPLEALAGSSDPVRIESAISAGGLRLDRSFSVGLERAEHSAETDGSAPRRLVHLARLLRQPTRYIEMFGKSAYDTKLSDCLWHVFRMMGKLDSRVYVLTKPE